MPPRLLTLGQLKLSGLNFKREKPLLLLTYLCLSGTQLRRRVAQQFWPDAADPMNSLAVAAAQLRRADPGLIVASETQLHTPLSCDVQLLREALAAAIWRRRRHSTRGRFWLTCGSLNCRKNSKNGSWVPVKTWPTPTASPG